VYNVIREKGYENMKFLVTGGAGFIGSHTVDYLIKLNHKVTVIDNESSPSNEKFYWNEAASNHKLDIRDFEKIRPLFEGIDYVIHLAAQARIQRAFEEPELTLSTNVLGTFNVLECARSAGVKRVLYSSTSSAYGNNEVPNFEEQPNDCLNLYSASKVFGEDLCKMYYRVYNLQTVILRYFNVYGDRQPSKGDFATAIGAFEKQVQEGKKYAVVYGSGEQRRSFIHVDDVVHANILSCTAFPFLSGDQLGRVYNIGSGKNYSINEVADLYGLEKRYLPERPGEAANTVANSSAARKALLWAPSKLLETHIKNFMINY
jgi:UDP-glucose 4-epimerase